MENKTCALLHKIDRNKDICINCIFITRFFLVTNKIIYNSFHFFSVHILHTL